MEVKKEGVRSAMCNKNGERRGTEVQETAIGNKKLERGERNRQTHDQTSIIKVLFSLLKQGKWLLQCPNRFNLQ
jgi:hypothetical protein